MTRRAFNAGLTGAAALAAMPGDGSATGSSESRALNSALDRHVAGGSVPGLVALVAKGDKVHVHVAGMQSLETRAPMQRDTIFAVASIGKPITAVSVLILVEEGVLGLDDPVDKWLPELADRRVIRSLESDLDDTVPANRPITVRDLLTLRMGLEPSSQTRPDRRSLQRMNELQVSPGPKLFGHSRRVHAEDRLASSRPSARRAMALSHGPGRCGCARRAGERKELGRVPARAHFRKPLGMVDTGFYVPPEKAARLATCYARNPETNELAIWNPASGASFTEPPPFEAGGGGHVSTVDDFLAFGRMLLGKGEYRGRRIISEESVAVMVRDQITPEQKAVSPFFPNFWDTYGWGLGIAITTAPDDISSVSGRFGWWGGFGTTFFVDPKTETVALLFSQRLMGGADDTVMSEDFLKRAFRLEI